MARFSCLSIRLALRLLLLFAILLQILARSPVDAKVISYSHASNLDAHKNRGPVINRPSHRLRIERRAPLAVDTVSTLAPESTAVADQTLLSPSHKTSHPYSRSVEQGRPTPSFSVTLGPQESEVSLWPSHVRLGSDQTDFVGWPGSGGLLALGILGTVALITALALRIHITDHLLIILITSTVLMIGTSIELSMHSEYSRGKVRSYGRCICSALAYAEATWATCVWVYLVIFHKSTAMWLSHSSPPILTTGGQPQDHYPELIRTTRLTSGVLTFLIGLFEVCWRVTLVRDYPVGWHLQQTSVMLQFIFSLIVGIPIARFCSYEWVECQQVRNIGQWLATTCLFLGWAIGTGRLAAAFRVLGFSESPLGRLLWLLQLLCFTVAAISLNVLQNRQRGDVTGELQGVIIEKPLPCIPSDSTYGRRLTTGTTASYEGRTSGPTQAVHATSGLTAGQVQDLASMRPPRRKQPLVEGSTSFPVPPSTPAGVPSSVYLPAETPSMYVDSMRAEYLAFGPRERAISLPLNRLPLTPSSHGAGLSISDLDMTLPGSNSSGAKLCHRRRSSSLGDALTRRTSHDTFMARKRRYEGRAQVEKHRRARSASSDMTHLTVTSFFNQFPAPPAMLPIPFHLTQYNRGQSGMTLPASRPSSLTGGGAGHRAHPRSRISRPFLASKLGHNVFEGGALDDDSHSSGTHGGKEDSCHYTPRGHLLQEDHRFRVNSLLSMEGVALTDDGKAVAGRHEPSFLSLDQAERKRRSTASAAKPQWSRRRARAPEASGSVLDTSADGTGVDMNQCPFPASHGALYAAYGAEGAASHATRESKGRSVTFSIEGHAGEAAERMT